MRSKHIFLAAVMAACPAAADAQGGIARVLDEIAANSTTLSVLDRTAEAERAAAHAETALPDPEAGFNYLFGSQSDMGRRQDYSVSQSFDVATLSGVRRRVAGSRDSVSAAVRDEGRAALLLEAKRQCIAVVYENQRQALFARRRDDMTRLAALMERREAEGDATALETGNVRLALSAVEADCAESAAARAEALAALASMNGGRAVDLPDTVYGTAPLPADFDTWFDGVADRWPALRRADAEAAAAEQSVRLTRQENLPSLSVGYMQETTPGEAWRGLSFGLTVPLWSNRAKRRQAEAAQAEAEARRVDAGVQLRAALSAQHARAAALGKGAAEMRRGLAASRGVELLAEALASGQLSLIDYLQEMDRYYDMALRGLEMERDAELAKAELTAADL